MNEEGVRIVESGRSHDHRKRKEHITRGGVRSWNEEGVRIVESGRSQDHRKRKESGSYNEGRGQVMERGSSQDHVTRGGVRSWNEEGVRIM